MLSVLSQPFNIHYSMYNHLSLCVFFLPFLDRINGLDTAGIPYLYFRFPFASSSGLDQILLPFFIYIINQKSVQMGLVFIIFS